MEIDNMGKYWALLGACPNTGPMLCWFKPVCALVRALLVLNLGWIEIKAAVTTCVINMLCSLYAFMFHSMAREDLKGKERKEVMIKKA